MAASTIPSGALPDVVRLAVGTYASGTDTVAAGATSKAVTHGLGATPDINDIRITPQATWAAVTKWWVSAVSSTTFTVTVDQVPGGGGFVFGWGARTAIV